MTTLICNKDKGCLLKQKKGGAHFPFVFPPKQFQSSSNSVPIQVQFNTNSQLEVIWSYIVLREHLQVFVFVELTLRE